jgi:TonB family protein
MKTLRLLAAGSALLGAALPAFCQFVTPDYVPMRCIQTEPAVFPVSVLPLGITTGMARVAIQIDDAGRLTDYVVSAYTYPAFADAAVAALKKWQFRPAQIRGFARSATADLSFTFKSGFVVVDMTRFSVPEMIHYRLIPNAMAFSACTLAELDRIPTPTRIIQPEFEHSLGRRHEVRITVEFYIDQDGHVRLPAVSPEMNQANEELSAAAVHAVEQWQFEPPVAKGKPALVLAQQDFDFKGASH